MRLYNFLVDYRKSSKDTDKEVDVILESHIFEQGLDDNNIVSIAVGNQSSRGRGRPSLHKLTAGHLNYNEEISSKMIYKIMIYIDPGDKNGRMTITFMLLGQNKF